MMLLSWTLATNCAWLYNLAIGGQHPLQNTAVPWQFSLSVTSDQVYDGFTILSLLEDCQLRCQILTVPHGGPAKERFKAAVQAWNNCMWLYGQPELRHHCLTCTCFFEGKHLFIYHFSDVNWFPGFTTGNRKVSVAVIDGVTIGHPCCAVHNCHLLLENNQHRFCTAHQGQEAVCAVIGCSQLARPSHKTCKHPDHEKVEGVHNDHGQACFQLQECLRHAHIAHPNDALGADIVDSSDLVDGEDVVEAFDVAQDGQVLPIEDPMNHPKVCAQFGCRQTHKEQLIVAPCGMIIACKTFYGAEAVTTVIVSLVLVIFATLQHHTNHCFRRWSSVLTDFPDQCLSTFFLTTTAHLPRWWRTIQCSGMWASQLMFSTSNASTGRWIHSAGCIVTQLLILSSKVRATELGISIHLLQNRRMAGLVGIEQFVVRCMSTGIISSLMRWCDIGTLWQRKG